MISKRRRTGILVSAAVLVIAGVGWAVFMGVRLLSALDEAATDAGDVRDALSRGDNAGARAAAADLRRSSVEADDLASGVTWSLATLVPWIGDDARGVQTVASVAADLSDRALPGVLDAAERRDELAPQNGRVDVDAVAALQDPIAAAAEAFAAADERLAAQDSTGFVERLRLRYDELADTVHRADAALRSAGTAVEVLPAMLGASRPSHQLLVFQNNAEIRATGGLPGALSLMRTDQGRIKMTRQLTAGAFPELPSPVLPLTDAERAVYDVQLGTFFQDANFTPDFPRTAELWRAHWDQQFPEQLDGVISIDPVALSYILEATGPVQVQGVELTAANAVDELLHRVYVRLDDFEAQDAFFGQVARKVFRAVSTQVQDPQLLVEALARAAAEHRLYIHQFEQDIQDSLAGSAVAGELQVDRDAPPQVGVYLNDGTGSKMSYFLDHDVDVSAVYCRDGMQGLSGSALLRSTAPPDAASLPVSVTGPGTFGTERGAMTVFVRLYGPVEGRITEVRAGNQLFEVAPIDQDGRPVVTVSLQLDPGEEIDLRWRMVTGRGQTEDVEVGVSPGIAPEDESFVAPSACA